MVISVGRIVHFTLTTEQADRINRRALPQVGNRTNAGDIVPLIVVSVGTSSVNGQAMLDGNDTLWITSAKEGTEPGTWSWPPRQ
jgi:hypothetical protein